VAEEAASVSESIWLPVSQCIAMHDLDCDRDSDSDADLKTVRPYCSI
jgi:hypothetical protein